MNFKQWLEDTGDNVMQFTSKDDYDQGLETPLGCRKPLIPNTKSKLGKKIEKKFKGGTEKTEWTGNPIHASSKEAVELLKQGWVLYSNPEQALSTLISPNGDWQSVRLNLVASLLKKGIIISSPAAKQIVLSYRNADSPHAQFFAFNAEKTESPAKP